MSGIVQRLCNQGRLKEVLHVMSQRGIRPDSSTYASLLQVCGTRKALAEGKLVHAHMIDVGFNPDVFLCTKLVTMYAKCGSLVDARQILDRMPLRNVVPWTALIAACGGHGLNEDALTLYSQMQREGIRPNKFTFSGVLAACANLEALKYGKEVHEDITRSGFQSDVFVGSALVNMYAKCGYLEDAREVFDGMPKRNVVSWTAMIAGYSRNGQVNEAVKLFHKMPERDVVSGNAMVAGYAQNGHVDEALKLFQQMPERNAASWNGMISGYAQTGRVDEALKLFQQMPERNAVSWNAIIGGYAQNGFVEEALKLFQKMPGFVLLSWNAMIAGHAQHGHVREALKLFQQMPEQDLVSWNAMMAGFAQNGQVDEALKHFQKMPERDMVSWNVLIAGYTVDGHVHDALNIFQKTPARNTISWTSMIVGYAQNGQVEEILKFFQKMPGRDVVSWNAMIAGYVQNGHFNEALKIYRQMQWIGVKSDSTTFASILSACANLASLTHGKEVHENTIKSGFQLHISVGSALIDMYAKCGLIDDAREVFDDMPEQNIVSWTAMVAGYAQNGQADEALKLFNTMPEQNVVSWTAMVAGYAQIGQVDEALKMFEKNCVRDVVSWNAMIGGFTQNGHCNKALKLFQQMRLAGAKPDSVTFTSVLAACANLAALMKGMQIHGNIITSGYKFHVSVGNALVDMYAKCGTIEGACRVFDKMHEQDIVSLNTMIVGYAKHGCGREALQLFERMKHSCMKPNHVTFIGVLSACSHAGLVDEGHQYFYSMIQDHHIIPAVEHYCCMVDLLGRAGCLDEALDFINKMPIKANAAVWGSLLGACRIHTNVKLGEHVAERLFQLEPKNAACYVLLSNIYAAASRWEDVEKVRKVMKDCGIKKIPGCSWIEVDDNVYSFLVRERSHLQTHKVYAELERLSQQMQAGYVLDMDSALHGVENRQTEQILCHIRDKQAIPFGIHHTSPGTPVRIIQSL